MFSLPNINSQQVEFSFRTGLSPNSKPNRRFLSEMRGMYADQHAYDEALAAEDRLLYEFFDMGVPKDSGNVAYGTSILYPGKIGDEYHMTKGHFHSVIDTAEVYYCLNGEGLMLMENPEGVVEAQKLTPGKAVYVPGRFAHRSINTGTETMVTFFAFPAHAGHNYATIESEGFRKLVVDRNGTPTLVDNPRKGNNQET